MIYYYNILMFIVYYTVLYYTDYDCNHKYKFNYTINSGVAQPARRGPPGGRLPRLGASTNSTQLEEVEEDEEDEE